MYIPRCMMCTVNSVVESVLCILYILHCTLKYQTQCRFGLGGVTEAHSAANWAHILYSYTLHAVSYTALICFSLHWTALHCTALHCTTMHYIALHCTAVYCTARYYTVLHCRRQWQLCLIIKFYCGRVTAGLHWESLNFTLLQYTVIEFSSAIYCTRV